MSFCKISVISQLKLSLILQIYWDNHDHSVLKLRTCEGHWVKLFAAAHIATTGASSDADRTWSINQVSISSINRLLNVAVLLATMVRDYRLSPQCTYILICPVPYPDLETEDQNTPDISPPPGQTPPTRQCLLSVTVFFTNLPSISCSSPSRPGNGSNPRQNSPAEVPSNKSPGMLKLMEDRAFCQVRSRELHAVHLHIYMYHALILTWKRTKTKQNKTSWRKSLRTEVLVRRKITEKRGFSQWASFTPGGIVRCTYILGQFSLPSKFLVGQ